MSEFKSHVEVSVGSEKGFGIVIAIVFLINGFYPVFIGSDLRLWSIVIALTILMLVYFSPKTLLAPNRLWFKLGMILGAIVSPVIMALIFFIVITPIGFLMRLFGKDILQKKFDNNTNSYWIKRDNPMGSMKDQF